MSDFLFRKPPKVILDDKTLWDKKRTKINPADVEETEEVFDVPEIMKEDDTDNWEQYKHSSIDGFLKQAAFIPIKIVKSYFDKWFSNLIHASLLKENIDEYKNLFHTIFNKYFEDNKENIRNKDGDITLIINHYIELVPSMISFSGTQADRDRQFIINFLKNII